MLSITGVMVLPAYLSSSVYLWKICEDHEYPKETYIKRSSALFSAIIGSFYALWLIYAAGLQYLLMAVIFMAIGIPVYIWARKQYAPSYKPFSRGECALATMLVIISIVAVYAMSTSIVKI